MQGELARQQEQHERDIGKIIPVVYNDL